MSIPLVLNRKNRILLAELTKTDFKLRYQGSILGYLWALLRPLMMFAILYIVFAKLLKIGSDIPHYPVYLLCGTTMWSFFTECTSQGIQAIVNRGDLLRKISFPKYIVVVSATLTAVINMLINLVVVIIFALINGVTPTWSWLIAIPAILQLYLLSLGIAFLLGSINVKYRDITSIWEVFIQAAKILLINPLSQAIQDIRFGIITHETITTWNYLDNIFFSFIPVCITLTILVIGAITFRKKSKFFAEEV